MIEQFDFQRFKSMLILTRGNIRIKGFFLIGVVLMIVFAMMENMFPNSTHSAYTIFFVFMIMRNNTFFSQFSDKGLLSHYLLLPATRVEKFTALLTGVFLEPILLSLFITVGEKLLILIITGHSPSVEYLNWGAFWGYTLFFSSLLLIRMGGGLLSNLQAMAILYIALFGGAFIGMSFLFKQMGLMPYLKENGIYLMMLLSIGAIGQSYRFYRRLEVRAFTVRNNDQA